MAREVVTIKGLEGVLDTLKKLPPEIVSKRGGPVKSALRKAALVIRNEAQANVQKIIDTPNLDGERSKSIGLLKQNIIASRNPRPNFRGEGYLVRVKRKVYPDSRGRRVTTSKVGTILEVGSERQTAKPWMRPAMVKAPQAVDVFVVEIRKRIAAIKRKLGLK